MKINDSKIKRLFLLVAAFAFLSAAFIEKFWMNKRKD